MNAKEWFPPVPFFSLPLIQFHGDIITDYVAAAVGGAIAAIPCPASVKSFSLQLVFSAGVGAAGNVASDLIKGDINETSDYFVSAGKGAFANTIGFLEAKGMAASMSKEIGSMPRYEEKRFLRDNIFHCSQGNVNVYLHEFTNSSPLEKMRLIEGSSMFAFKTGIYSTTTSSLILTEFGLLVEGID